MELVELIPLLLAILWVIVIPIMRSNSRKKAKAKPVTINNSTSEEFDDHPKQGDVAEDLLHNIFGLPVEKPKPQTQTPIIETKEKEKPYRRTYELAKSSISSEGISVFEDENSITSPEAFSYDEESIYKEAGRDVKDNIRQAVIFSEILRRPYAD